VFCGKPFSCRRLRVSVWGGDARAFPGSSTEGIFKRGEIETDGFMGDKSVAEWVLILLLCVYVRRDHFYMYKSEFGERVQSLSHTFLVCFICICARKRVQEWTSFSLLLEQKSISMK
jgi:hypothetical protein